MNKQERREKLLARIEAFKSDVESSAFKLDLLDTVVAEKSEDSTRIVTDRVYEMVVTEELVLGVYQVAGHALSLKENDVDLSEGVATLKVLDNLLGSIEGYLNSLDLKESV